MQNHTPEQLEIEFPKVHLCECGCGEPVSIVRGQPMRFVKGHNSRQRRRLNLRFWEKVDRRGPDDCWEWMGTKNKLGYGILKVEKQNKKAYRLSYELHYGPIPDGLWVLHHCDNPSCVNPQHLFLGTRQDNIDDMVSKRRQHYGEKTPTAKLVAAQIKEIRQSAENGILAKELAHRYKVSLQAIYDILHRHSWKHVP